MKHRLLNDYLLRNAGYYLVEIRSSQTVSADMLAGLRWWWDLSGEPIENATLVHGGQEHYNRSGVAVRPWFGV